MVATRLRCASVPKQPFQPLCQSVAHRTRGNIASLVKVADAMLAQGVVAVHRRLTVAGWAATIFAAIRRG